MKYVKTLLLLLSLTTVILAALILYPMLSQKVRTHPLDTVGTTDNTDSADTAAEKDSEDPALPSATGKADKGAPVTGQEKAPAGTGNKSPAGTKRKSPAVPGETAAGETAAEEKETASPDTQPAKKPVKPAADFSVYDTEGRKVRLSDFTGNPTVVNFWATWCGYCVGELPAFQSAYEKYGGKVNFLIVDLTDGFRESADKALSFVKNKGYTFPLYFDTELSAASAYGVRSIPMTLFLNADGSLYKTFSGVLDSAALDSYLHILTEE